MKQTQNNTLVFLFETCPTRVQSPLIRELEALGRQKIPLTAACLNKQVECDLTSDLPFFAHVFCPGWRSVPAGLGAVLHFALSKPRALARALRTLVGDRRQSFPQVLACIMRVPKVAWLSIRIQRMSNPIIYSQGSTACLMASWLISALIDRPYFLALNASDIAGANGDLERTVAGAEAIITRSQIGHALISRRFENGRQPRVHLLSQSVVRCSENGKSPAKNRRFTFVAMCHDDSIETINGFLAVCQRLASQHMVFTSIIVCEEAKLTRVKSLILDADLEHLVTCAAPQDSGQFSAICHLSHVMVSLSYSESVMRGDYVCHWILEAMAAGLAVIAAEQPVIREAVKDFVTGLLIPPEDPVALISAIQTLYHNPPLTLQLGRRARHQATRRFNLDDNMTLWRSVHQTQVAATATRSISPAEPPHKR